MDQRMARVLRRVQRLNAPAELEYCAVLYRCLRLADRALAMKDARDPEPAR